jgi:hypothetical protein
MRPDGQLLCGLNGSLRLSRCSRACHLQCARAPNDFDDLFQMGDRAVLNGLAHQVAFGIAAPLHGGDERQRGLAFTQIVAETLAHDGSVAGIVQHIVNDLKGGAQGLSILGARIFQPVVGSGQYGSAACAGFEELGSL